jgi:CBS domain-containing protein
MARTRANTQSSEPISALMTPDPVTLSSRATVEEAARRMRDAGIGDVIVLEDDQVCGILTDRDIVVRAIAEGHDPAELPVAAVCSRELTTLSPDDSVERAVQLMQEKAIRRLPVVEGGRPVGIVSLGDLAIERDPDSALGQISSAAPNE